MNIVGICLVKNEDRFVRQALENVLDFCDSVIVLDNGSTDNTYPILEGLCREHGEKIQLHRLSDALLSHGFVERYANTDTWIFAIDGDELYDRKRLARFRETLRTGTYSRYWNILGNCIHVNKLDTAEHAAYGYMAPPSRSITKLYNFNAITEWREYAERLHGTNMRFKEGFGEHATLLLHDTHTWEESPLRCLHLCFVKRSSLRTPGNTRFNPSENAKWYFPVVNFFRNVFHGNISFQSSYKLKKYQRGGINKVSCTGFL